MRSLYVIMSFISQRKTQANNRELLWLRMFEFFISYVTKGCFARNDVYRRSTFLQGRYYAGYYLYLLLESEVIFYLFLSLKRVV